MMRCAECLYSEELYPAENGDEGRNVCNYPIKFLPLSMQGVANRDRETVNPDRTDCPTATPRP